jgi:hypothetical protein
MSSIPPPPLANSFVIGTAVINTHTHANSFVLGPAVINTHIHTSLVFILIIASRVFGFVGASGVVLSINKAHTLNNRHTHTITGPAVINTNTQHAS